MTAADFTIERTVGRLVEARVFSLATVSDVGRYGMAFGPHVAGGGGLVLCADHRAVRVYAPDVADALIALFTKLNKVWIRALLLAAPSNATLTIQLTRVVRESKSASRRFLVDPQAGEAFLAEVLTNQERERLRQFLGSG